MSHVRDRWTKIGPNGRRIHGERWGQGKRWQARWDEDGVEKVKAFDTKDAAEYHLAQVATGAYTTAAAIVDGTTLRAYAETWLAGRLDLRPASMTQIKSRLNVRILPTFGDQPIAAITRADVKAAIIEWSAESGPRTVRATHGTLSQLFRHAIDDGLLTANPAKGIPLPRVSRDRLDIPDAAKVREVAAAMWPHLSSMVTVAAATGLRLGELRGLTADCIKGDVLQVKHQLSINGDGFADTKTSAGVRSLHMGKIARDAIRKHLEAYGEGPDRLIWREKDNTPLTHRRATEAWQKMRKTVPGLPKRGGWHLLRHYNASVLIAAGLSVRAVADRLGHEDPAITLRTYAHLWPTDQTAAAAAIDAALAA